eukprot:TRINITY_DN5435_c0_g1_i4.p1 TRINITY_DN5435_c0_g1~~TRINITY_DN5435_c0_g1_i4.p1  ORF type:complete len:582 (-),score=134.45 TRINITY_DN5435_c0_g1_i4:72-1817(-)
MSVPSVPWRKFSKWIQHPSPPVRKVDESPAFLKQQEDVRASQKSIQDLLHEATLFCSSLQVCSQKALSFGHFMSTWSASDAQIPEVALALSTLGQLQYFFSEMILLMNNHITTHFVSPLKKFLEVDYQEYEKSKKKYEKMKVEYEEMLSSLPAQPPCMDAKFTLQVYEDHCRVLDVKTKFAVSNQEVADHLMHLLLKKDMLVLESLQCLLREADEFGHKANDYSEKTKDYGAQLEVQVQQHKVAFVAMKKEHADEITKMLDEKRRRKFHSLVELLAESNLDLVESMTEITRKDDFLKQVVSVLDGFNVSLLVLKSAISQEVASTTSEATLFRASNIHTKFINMYCRMISLTFIHDLMSPVVTEILAMPPGSLEVDPQRLQNTEEAPTNLIRLSDATKKVIGAILERGLQCPFRLRYALGYLKSETKRKFSDSKLSSVAGFLFLRLFSPALMTPETFGIVQDSVPPHSRRALTLVAKILQNIANGVHFGEKEAYMVALNPLIEAYIPQIHAYLEQIAFIPDSAQDNTTIISQKEAEMDILPQIHRALVLNMDGIEEHLTQKNQRELAYRLASVLGSLGRPKT